jgi:predicted RNA-binding protein with PUA-like domain
MKTEPGTYSIDDLQRQGLTPWEGVRNYQARNFMRDGMKVGDRVLFYHSNAKPPGVAGVGEVCREAYPDHFAWDPASPYYDPKSSPEHPVWQMVDVAFVEKFASVIPLDALRKKAALKDMLVLKKGMRLSVQPVTAREFKTVVAMAERE